jgi:MFS family permease
MSDQQPAIYVQDGSKRTEGWGPSLKSLRGLDGINFLMADVRDGVGPYLSVFLKGGQNWEPGAIGIAMAASSIASALCQIPEGLLVDSLKIKRLLVAVSGLMVAVGCVLIATYPRLPVVIGAQIMLGAASAIIPPAISAISLGLVGRKKLDRRISRNESFNHSGNFAAAALAGSLGQYLGYQWIFYLVCGFAIASAAVITLINPREIDNEVARGGESTDEKPTAFRDLLKRRDLLTFLVSVILFHFVNAAMLPMAGQVLAQTHPGSDAITLSACIIAAQFVMIAVAWVVGAAVSVGYGRKTIFLVTLAVLPIRGLLFSFTSIWRGGDPTSRRSGSGYLRRNRHPDRLRSDARDGAFQFRSGSRRPLRWRRRWTQQPHLWLRRSIFWLPNRISVPRYRRSRGFDLLCADDARDPGAR